MACAEVASQYRNVILSSIYTFTNETYSIIHSVMAMKVLELVLYFAAPSRVLLRAEAIVKPVTSPKDLQKRLASSLFEKFGLRNRPLPPLLH